MKLATEMDMVREEASKRQARLQAEKLSVEEARDSLVVDVEHLKSDLLEMQRSAALEMSRRKQAEARVEELENEIMGVAFSTSEVAHGKIGLRIKQLEGQLELAQQENRLLAAQIEEARTLAGRNRGLGKDLEE